MNPGRAGDRMRWRRSAVRGSEWWQRADGRPGGRRAARADQRRAVPARDRGCPRRRSARRWGCPATRCGRPSSSSPGSVCWSASPTAGCSWRFWTSRRSATSTGPGGFWRSARSAPAARARCRRGTGGGRRGAAAPATPTTAPRWPTRTSTSTGPWWRLAGSTRLDRLMNQMLAEMRLVFHAVNRPGLLRGVRRRQRHDVRPAGGRRLRCCGRRPGALPATVGGRGAAGGIAPA